MDVFTHSYRNRVTSNISRSRTVGQRKQSPRWKARRDEPEHSFCTLRQRRRQTGNRALYIIGADHLRFVLNDPCRDLLPLTIVASAQIYLCGTTDFEFAALWAVALVGVPKGKGDCLCVAILANRATLVIRTHSRTSPPSKPPASRGSSFRRGLWFLIRFSTILMCSTAGMFSGSVPPMRLIASRTSLPTCSWV